MRRTTLIAAVMIAIATSAGGAVTASAAVHPATFPERDEGTGATLSQAEFSARQRLQIDYGPCTGIVLIDDGQFADGTWWADEGGNCSAFH